MKLELKPISRDAFPAALAKAVHYRQLNEPGEAESICRDILAVDPQQQEALRLLGLSLTDQFHGGESDPYVEAERTFAQLSDPYSRVYFKGLTRERRAKAEMRVGHPTYTVTALLRDALLAYAEAEKIRPAGNDDSILRWNRCVRLVRSRPEYEWALRDSAG